MRGAVFFIGMALWGSQRVESLKHPVIAVLPAFTHVSDVIAVLSAFTHLAFSTCIEP